MRPNWTGVGVKADASGAVVGAEVGDAGEDEGAAGEALDVDVGDGVAGDDEGAAEAWGDVIVEDDGSDVDAADGRVRRRWRTRTCRRAGCRRG